MRAILRKLVEALDRLDAKVRGFDERIKQVESLPPGEIRERVIERVIQPQEPQREFLLRVVDQYFEENPIPVPENGKDASAEQIAQAVADYLAENPPADGEPGKDATFEQIAQAVAEYLADRLPSTEVLVQQATQEATEQATAQATEQAIERVLADVLPRVPKAADVAADAAQLVDYERIVRGAVKQIPVPENGAPGERGQDGRSVEKAEIIGRDLFITLTGGEPLRVGQVVGRDGKDGQTIVRVEPGIPGTDGRGIESIEQDKDSIVITLTDGEKFPFALPKPRSLIGGGGVSESRVLQLIAQNGGGGGGGEGRQEVFIGEPATPIDYPAIILAETVVNGETVFEFVVNLP